MHSFLSSKKNSILISLITSYLLIFVLPLAANTILFNKSANAIKAKIMSVTTGTLNLIYSRTENILQETKVTYSTLIHNENIRKLLNTEAHNKEAIQYLSSAILHAEFQNPIYSDDFGYFMYYKKPQIIITKNSRYTPDLSFNLIDDNTGQPCSEVMNMLNEVTEKSVMQISDKFSVLAYPVYDTNSPIISGVFAVYFSNSYILDIKKELKMYDDASFVITSPNNTLLTINETEIDTKQLYNYSDSYFGTKNNVVLLKKSDIANIKYALVSNESAFYRELRHTKSMMFLQSLFTIICGLCIIYLSIKRNYIPVKEIVHLITPNSANNSNMNEYELIKNTFNKNIKELLSLREERTNMNILLYELSVRNIILGNIYSEQEYLEFVRNNNVKLHSDDYCVIIIHIDNFKEMFADDFEIKDDKSAEHIVKYAINNIVFELGNLNNSMFTCELNNNIVCVLNTNSGNPSELAQEIQKIIKSYLKVDISASISSIHKDYTMIPTCYLEASTAMEHILLTESKSILCYDDLPFNSTEYTFSIEEEITLIDAIKSGNYDAAQQIINSLFDDKSACAGIDRFVIFDVAGAVLKSIDAANKIYCYDEDVNFDNHLILKEISSHNTVDETRIKLLNIIKQFCNIVNEHKISKNSGLINDIIEHVDNNFKNADLGVYQIAEIFKRNPAYISRLFKEKKGISLLEYINYKRIEYSKTLLSQDLSINDIAVMCGFANTPSFIRVFKKYVGVAPGKYRNELC